MRLFGKSIIFFIKCYQVLISPLFFPCCRFYPTCSEYAIQAIRRYGVLKGVYSGIVRLFRCHPLSQGGYDPVR